MITLTEGKSAKIYREIKSRITQGAYPSGSRLPKEVELSAQFGVARDTLRPALEQLASEHFIERIKGKGTFVAARPGRKVLLITHDESSISNPNLYITPGILQAAAERGIRVEICSYRMFSSLGTGQAVASLREHAPRGIILLASNFNGSEKILEILRIADIPALLVHGIREDSAVTNLRNLHTDFAAGMVKGYAFLRDCGYHRVGHIGVEDMSAIFRGMPHADYREMLADFGMEYCADWIVGSDYTRKNVAAALDRLLRSSRKIDALYCYSDTYAIYAYEYLKSRGIRIPDDLGVLAMGGSSAGDYLQPRLSVIDLNYPGIGRSALEELLHMEQSAPLLPAENIACPIVIRERESTKNIIRREP